MLDAARALFGVAPADFVAARNALVKQLKAAGDPDSAQRISVLRRPRLAEYALNRLARDDRDLIATFTRSISAAQHAQSAAIGGDAADLRAATADLRRTLLMVTEAAVAVLTADGANGEGQRDDIVGLLRGFVATARPGPLVAGIVGAEALVDSGEFFPGAPDPPGDPSRRKSAAASTPAPTPAPAPERPTAAAKRAMRRAERNRLQDVIRSADAEVSTAEQAVETAKAELSNRRAALKRAEAATRTATAVLAAFDADADADLDADL
jgi:hypothetical protein